MTITSSSLTGKLDGKNLSTEHQFTVLAINVNPASLGKPSGNDFLRKGIFQKTLNGPLQRPGPKDLIKPFFHQQINSAFGQFNLDVSVFQPLGNFFNFQINDLI